MTQFVESLRRLYRAGKLGAQILNSLLSSGKISKQDYMYIVAAEESR